MPFEAEAVHGLSNLFLSDKPLFADRVEELLEFLEDSPLVAHNAVVRFRLSQPRASALRPAVGVHEPDGRHFGARALQAPGRQA